MSADNTASLWQSKYRLRFTEELSNQRVMSKQPATIVVVASCWVTSHEDKMDGMKIDCWSGPINRIENLLINVLLFYIFYLLVFFTLISVFFLLFWYGLKSEMDRWRYSTVLSNIVFTGCLFSDKSKLKFDQNLEYDGLVSIRIWQSNVSSK